MLNHTILQGRLVRDPELRYTQSGTAVASFTVAWSEKFKETEKQLFLDCTAWNGTGELISKHFEKGKEIIVEGKLTTRKWQDKEGNNRTSTELTVERVHFCGSKSDSSGSGGARSSPIHDSEFRELGPDDEDGIGELPF